jgi:peptidoglycan/xylan/chitin deacetylase (PgdA/CDA1 family)
LPILSPPSPDFIHFDPSEPSKTQSKTPFIGRGFFTFFTVMIWTALSFPGLRIAAAQEGQDPSGLHFGSRKILETCWSAEELGGTFGERQGVRRRPGPTETVPERLQPRTTLPPLKPEWRDSIRRVTPSGIEKVLALTFDLCETAGEETGYDAEVIHVLRNHRAKATFFAGGKWMKTHPNRAKQLMADPLFEIGNHTWTHANLRLLDERRIREQVLWTQAQYEVLRDEMAGSPCIKALGPAEMEKIPGIPSTFRFPYGSCSPQALEIVADAGLAAVQWDVVLGDPAVGQPVSTMVETVLRRSKSGSIIVGHANGRNYGTAEVLRIVIPELAARGFHFVTVSELLRLGKVISFPECYELAPGDTLRYDQTHRKESSGSP